MVEDKFCSYMYGKKSSIDKLDLDKKTKEILLLFVNDIINKYQSTNSQYKSSVFLERWKGKSGLKITKYPKLFKIIQFKKSDPDSKPKEQITFIDLDVFNKVIKILAIIPKNKPIKIREFSEKFCKEFEMLEFFNKGEFDYEKLFGTRSVYIKEIYYPLKIAENYGIINYNKRGWIERLTDGYEIPVEISEEWGNGI